MFSICSAMTQRSETHIQRRGSMHHHTHTQQCMLHSGHDACTIVMYIYVQMHACNWSVFGYIHRVCDSIYFATRARARRWLHKSECIREYCDAREDALDLCWGISSESMKMLRTHFAFALREQTEPNRCRAKVAVFFCWFFLSLVSYGERVHQPNERACVAGWVAAKSIGSWSSSSFWAFYFTSHSERIGSVSRSSFCALLSFIRFHVARIDLCVVALLRIHWPDRRVFFRCTLGRLLYTHYFSLLPSFVHTQTNHCGFELKNDCTALSQIHFWMNCGTVERIHTHIQFMISRSE